MRKCVICGKEFTPRLEIQKTCGSEECKKENARRVAKDYYHKSATKLEAKKCVECGKTFMPRTSQQVTCGTDCRKIRAKKAARKWQAEHKKEPAPKEKKTYQKICLICHKEYTCKNPRQKYCGEACARVAAADQQMTNSYRVREMARERKREEQRQRRIQTSHESLVDASMEARAAGMSYGQWQARRYAHGLERCNR